MAGATVDLGDEELEELLARAARRLIDTQPLMKQIGDQLVRSSKERFRSLSAPDGSPWKPKSATTIAAQMARFGRSDPRPLHGDSRNLRQQIFAEVGFTGRSVEWGSNLIYAAVQQWGAKKGQFGSTSRGAPIPWGDIPARPFIGMSDDDLAATKSAIGAWLRSALPD